MNLYDFDNGSGIFIQIGAGVGDLDKRANYRDGFTEFIKKLPRQRIKKIILVEPNHLNISLLRECWKDYPEAIIYEMGIIPKNYKNKTMDLYYCPLDAPHYQVASINKSHIQKFYGDNCELNKFTIPVKELEDFINEIISEEVELLSLDIEGIDAEVILGINFNNLKLKYISFEHLHLGEHRENVLSHLKSYNYVYLGLGVDYNGFDYLFINGNYKNNTETLDDFLNKNNCFVDEGHSQQCNEQINLLIKLIKNDKIKNIVEIGFNAGHSAEIFLKNNPNIVMTSFDLGYHSYTSVGKQYIDMTYPGRHTLILGDSLQEVPAYSENTKFDIIFIDGGHAYNVAYGDIINCKKLAHENTIIIMDDTHFPITNINHTHDPTLAWSNAIKENIIIPIWNIDYDYCRGLSLGKYYELF